MDLEFNKVTYDGELADFSEEELRELISEFETAQESNVAEFEQAAEAIDDVDESTIEEFEEAREALIDEIVEAETFDEVPLTEENLADEDFSDLRDWQDFVQDQSEADEEDGSNEADFDDMGKKSPVNPDEDEADFAEEALSHVQGLNI